MVLDLCSSFLPCKAVSKNFTLLGRTGLNSPLLEKTGFSVSGFPVCLPYHGE